MTDYLMNLNLLQLAAIGGVAVLLIPVVWDVLKWSFRKTKGVLPSRKPQAVQPGVTFEHVMEIRELLVSDGNEHVMEAFDGSIVPALVRALANQEK